MEEHKFTNKLASQTSPYLLQHAHNPVNWYPWGEEAIELAQKENKLIFLSIGYSACHWCHVMEEESFEDPGIARILNDHFVSIKVDREERPDIDHKFIDYAVLLRGSAGWPLSVFLTPNRDPVYIATYLPPRKTNHLFVPAFPDVLQRLYTLWSENQEMVENSSFQLKLQYEQSQYQILSSKGKGFLRTPEERTSILRTFYGQKKKKFDKEWGGFKEDSSTKFVRPHQISSMIRLLCSEKYGWAEKKEDTEFSKEMVKKTLKYVLNGGIHDQVWGGFHRYSVDQKWLVPHFEKMLYDQAGMVHLLLDAAENFDGKNKSRYVHAAKKCVDMVCRDMMTPKKEFFYASLDADDSVSRKEGLWYLWTVKEILSVLGEEDGKKACGLWGVSEKGNFEGGNILSLIKCEDEYLSDQDLEFLEKCAQKMKKSRTSPSSQYRNPDVDTKILTDWNGQMIGAISRFSSFLDQEEKKHYLSIAAAVAKNILEEKSFVHCPGVPAFSTDYGFLMDGICYIYENVDTEEEKEAWKVFIEDLGSTVISRFFDPEKKIFSMQQTKELGLVYELVDGAKPSGNAMIVRGLWRAGKILENDKFMDTSKLVLDSVSSKIMSTPGSFAVMLDVYSRSF